MITLHQFHQAAEELYARFLGGHGGDALGHCRDSLKALPFAMVLRHQVAAFGRKGHHVRADDAFWQDLGDVEAIADGEPNPLLGFAVFGHQRLEGGASCRRGMLQ